MKMAADQRYNHFFKWRVKRRKSTEEKRREQLFSSGKWSIGRKYDK